MPPFSSVSPPPHLQHLLDDWIRGEAGGVALAWVDRGGVAFFESGRCGRIDPSLPTPETRFEIGSVTKVFTSVLLAESERLGKVTRDDPAAKYLFPATDPAQDKLAAITLLSLATHTSGLPRLPADLRADAEASPDPYAAYDHASLMAAFRTQGPKARVGHWVSYSNFGVSVLGEALAGAWGTTYPEALRRHVLAPLGMKGTHLGLADRRPVAEPIVGHARGEQVPAWHWLACAPCGGLRSSALELARFLAACIDNGDARPRDALRATARSQRNYDDIGGHIGLGWMLNDDPAKPIFWHNGATAGSHAFVAFSPNSGQGVAILANVQKESDPLGFALLGGRPTLPRTAVPNFIDFPGRYLIDGVRAVEITAADASLSAEIEGQPRVPLRETAPDRYAVIGLPLEFTFERGPRGRVVALNLPRGGRNHRAVRIE